MNFLYDYGHPWDFDLRVERIDPPGDEMAPIKVLIQSRKTKLSRE